MFAALDYRQWLIDVAVASFALLTVASLAVAMVRQPARRVHIIEWALVGCVTIALLCLFPDRPRWRTGYFATGTTAVIDTASAGPDAIDVAMSGSTASTQGIEPVTPATTVPVPVSDGAALDDVQPANSGDSVERPASATPSATSRFVLSWRWVGLAHGAIAACLLALWFLAIGALQQVRKRSRPAPESVRDLFREIAGPAGERVRLLIDAHGDRVFTFGWLRPAIVLTEELCRPESTERLRWSLAHEWSHVQRRDVRAWHLMSLAGPLCFFQPAFWWLRRQLRLNQEHLADAHGAAHAPAIEDYANYLLQLAAGADRRPLASMVTLGPLRSDLSARVVRLLRDRGRCESRCPRWWGLGVLIAGALVVGSASTFTLSAAAPESPSPDARNDSDDAKGVIHVRVVDEAGKPPVGITVQAHLGDRSVIELASDAEGVVRLAKTSNPQAKSIVFVAVTRDDRVGWREYSVGPKAPAATATDPLEMILLPRTRRLSGSLIDERGKPAQAVRVVAISLFEPTNGPARFLENRYRRSPLGETVTDESGAFSLSVPANASGFLRTRDVRFASQVLYFKATDERHSPVTVFDTGSIAGIVTDAQGNGIEGVRLGARILDRGERYWSGDGGEAVTDVKGIYRIEGLASGVYNLLYLKDADHPRRIARAVEGVRVRAGEDALADVEVIEGRRLSGTLLDLSNGKPIPDSWVGYFGPAWPRSSGSSRGAKTDEQGRFEFFVPPGDAHLSVMNRRDRNPEARRSLVVSEVRDPPPVELKIRTAAVRGVVVDEEGAPVANAALASDMGYTLVYATNDRGRFEFNPPPGAAVFRILADHLDYARAESQPIDITKIPDSVRIVLSPTKKTTVVGRAFGPDGKPLIGATASVYLKRGVGSWAQWGPRATTDANGLYKLRHVRKGDSFYVAIDKRGFTTASAQKIAKQTADRIEMESVGIEGQEAPRAAVRAARVIEKATRTLTGYLVDEHGRPFVGASVDFHSTKHARGVSDREGMFELRGLPEGAVEIHVTAEGYERLKKEVPAGENRFDLRLERSK